MDIKTIYQMVSESGQRSPREYLDVRNKSLKKLQIKQTRKKTFVEDIQKLGKLIPGPGKYEPNNPELIQVSHRKTRKVDIKEQAKKPSGRYTDKLLEQKAKIPGVGKYELEHDHTQELRSRYKIKGDKDRKQALIFKRTYFEDNQIDCIKVGPGVYSPNIHFGDIKSFRTVQEDHLAKNQDEYPDPNKEKKNLPKSRSLPKLPSSQTYVPIPQNYDTFDRKASISHSIGSKQTFTKAKRKVFQELAGPGPKYSLISQWSPKNRGKNGKNLFKSVSTMRQPGIYH